MPRLALGVDLGGTNLRCAVVTDDGTIVVQHQEPTQAERGPDLIIRSIAAAIEATASEAGVPNDVAVGIAAPGPLSPRTGIVHFAPNLPGWHDIPLRERIAQLTGRVVTLGNDANAAALGEYTFGAGRGHQHLIYVGLGTGVGGGVISAGRLIEGVRGMGGELGHVSVSMDGPRCHCGSVGCIEAYCSAWAITDSVARLIASQRGDAIVAAAQGAEPGPVAVGIAAEQGDPAAIALLQRAGTALGVGLANVVNIFNPEIIAIGGGLAELGELLIGPARGALAAWSMPMILESSRLVYSELGSLTGIYGAAALVFHTESGLRDGQ